MPNKFHSDIQQTDEKPPDGLPKAVTPSRSDKQDKPPFKGAVGPTGKGYPTIFKKVKTHAQSEGI